VQGEETFVVGRFSNPFRQKQQFLGSAEWLACRLGGSGVPNPSGWYQARCPAHDDDHASLSLKDGNFGLLVHCFAGCKPAAIWDAIITLRITGAFIAAPGFAPAGSISLSATDIQCIAMRIWNESQHAEGTLVDHYLDGRGLTQYRPYDILRFHPCLYHKESQTYAPAMVAMLQSAEHGRHVAIHRTWLDPAGGKAKLKPVRKALGPTLGHTVRLALGGNEVLLGEGIESVLAAMQLFGIHGGWAALSSSGLAGVVLPDYVDNVRIAADHDPVGLKAAYAARARLRREGRKVEIVYPPKSGMDFNDVLLGTVRS
jgi:putative DNA primase/helicase